MKSRFLLSIVLMLASCSHPGPAARQPSSVAPETPSKMNATLECVSRCAGGTAATSREKEIFWIQNYSDGLGNGNLPKALTFAFETWSRDRCWQRAVSACGRPERVAESRPTRATSGGWSAPLPIGCTPARAVVSPFDERSQAELTPSMPFEHGSRDWPGDGTLEPATVLEGPSAPACRFPISGKLCYGDCMAEVCPGDYQQCLATPKPNATSAVKICGDALAKRIREDRGAFPETYWLHACETVAARSVLADHRTMVSACAAVRGDFDCRAWVRARLKSRP